MVKKQVGKNTGKHRVKPTGMAVAEWEEYEWRRMMVGFSKIATTGKLEQALNSLLAPNEKKKMIRRMLGLEMLREGKSYLQIGELLWIAPETLSAIKKSADQPTSHYSSGWVRRNKNRRLYSTKEFKPEKHWLIALLDALPKDLSRFPFGIKYKGFVYRHHFDASKW